MSLTDQVELLATEIGDDVQDLRSRTHAIQFGGQFLLDPNEINGWAALGITDNTIAQDLGNVGATSYHYLTGGIMLPHDAVLKRFRCWHRNNNNAVQAWGWRIAQLDQEVGTTSTRPVDIMLDEVGDNAGVGPRDYGNNLPQITDVTTFANATVNAGRIVNLGVEAPTAVTTNYYVQVLAGYLEFEWVLGS